MSASEFDPYLLWCNADARSREYIAETKGQEAARKLAIGGISAGEKISRSTLEEEARQSSLTGHGTPTERFWARQQGQAETISVGRNYIAKAAPSASANSQSKKEL